MQHTRQPNLRDYCFQDKRVEKIGGGGGGGGRKDREKGWGWGRRGKDQQCEIQRSVFCCNNATTHRFNLLPVG